MRGAIEGLREHAKLLLGEDGVVGVDGFIDAGDDHGGVAGVLAGRIDGVLVPGAIGQPCGGEQIGFGSAQSLVQVREVAGRRDLQGVGLGRGSEKRSAAASTGGKVERGEAVILGFVAWRR